MMVQISDQWQQAVNLSAQDTTGRGRDGGWLDPSKEAATARCFSFDKELCFISQVKGDFISPFSFFQVFSVAFSSWFSR